MKVKYNDEEILSLNEIKESVLKDEIGSTIFEQDMIRRIRYIIMHKYEQCFENLRKEWEPKLKNRGVKMFPADDDEFAKLVFSQPDYLDRQGREKVSKSQ